jgi:drug/metabolite transporter (DMT)-like permease
MRNLRPVAALLLLSTLWALVALRSDLLPQFAPVQMDGPQFLFEALTLGLFSILTAAAAWIRIAPWPHGKAIGACAAVGVGLFAAPALLVHFSAGQVSDFTRVAVFSLVPVFSAVLEPHVLTDAATQNNRGLMAALVGVAGTLCIFPVDLPISFESSCALAAVVVAAACIAAANCWAVRIARETESLAPSAAIAGAGAALLLAAFSLTGTKGLNAERFGPQAAWAIAVDLPGLALLFWLMRSMTATRMSTRFLIAPLLASLAGLALLRAPIGIRNGLGLSLIALSSGWLLFMREDQPELHGSSIIGD